MTYGRFFAKSEISRDLPVESKIRSKGHLGDLFAFLNFAMVSGHHASEFWSF